MMRTNRLLTQYAAAVSILFVVPVAAQTAEDLRLTIGKSVVIDYPSDIRQISTSNPDVFDASPVTTKEILLHGKGLGTATMVVWSKSGERSFYNITVEMNLDPLRRLLRETFPNDEIQVRSSRDSLSLSGRVANKDVAERATALASSFTKTVVNNMQLAPPPVEKQVLIRVKFAEMDRNTASQFAINLVSTGALNTPGATTTGQFQSSRPTEVGRGGSTFSISDALNLFAFRPDLNLGIFVRALQNRGLLQILAEPNLVTSNGKEAQFLVGGEFPVPILQGGGNAGAVTIQFREFGIRLFFTPVITENKTIKMYLKQEVSTIDLANSVSFNGFNIPALSTRRAETNVELYEGQSFIVAGLVDNRETDAYSKIPGLGDIPIFGALFKSKSENRSRSELVVMVTPEITSPLNPGDPKPLPYMPKDFLMPIGPNDAKNAATAGKGKSKK
jgi:pilus assembly protein CpaC